MTSIITRIIPQNFQVTLPRPLTPLQHRAIVTAFAAAKLAEVQARNRSALGYEPKYTTTVDGREGGSVLGVKLDGGEIVYDFELYSDTVKNVIEEALKALRDASPVVSGAYRDGHTLYINGAAVDDVPDEIKPADEVMISNPVPYARRIEIGRTASGRSFVMQVPNRIYERVAKQNLSQRFGNQVKIAFEYVTLPDAYENKGGLQGAHYGTGRSGPRGGGQRIKRRQKVGDHVPSPAIVIRPLGD